MKKIISIMAVALVAATAFVSCSKDVDSMKTKLESDWIPEESTPMKGKIEFTLNSDVAVSTKADWDMGNTCKLVLYYDENDKDGKYIEDETKRPKLVSNTFTFTKFDVTVGDEKISTAVEPKEIGKVPVKVEEGDPEKKKSGQAQSAQIVLTKDKDTLASMAKGTKIVIELEGAAYKKFDTPLKAYLVNCSNENGWGWEVLSDYVQTNIVAKSE